MIGMQAAPVPVVRAVVAKVMLKMRMSTVRITIWAMKSYKRLSGNCVSRLHILTLDYSECTCTKQSSLITVYSIIYGIIDFTLWLKLPTLGQQLNYNIIIKVWCNLRTSLVA